MLVIPIVERTRAAFSRETYVPVAGSKFLRKNKLSFRVEDDHALFKSSSNNMSRISSHELPPFEVLSRKLSLHSFHVIIIIVIKCNTHQQLES